MLTVEDIDCKLITLAEGVRGTVLFDLAFEIPTTEFFTLKFLKDEVTKQKINSNIYKYNK